jgi:uncharacterized protein (TIGR00730 family)
MTSAETMTAKTMKRVCVFSGSNSGAREIYAEGARQLSRALVARGIGLVYGGGSIGLMGVMADTVLSLKGEVIGVIPESIALKEVAHQGLSELHVVGSMHERKALMAALSDSFIALPGGFGTFEELFEVITWAQLGLHHKPIGVLNLGGYFDAFSALVDQAITEQFIHPDYQRLIVNSADAETLLAELMAYQPLSGRRKWIELEEI